LALKQGYEPDLIKTKIKGCQRRLAQGHKSIAKGSLPSQIKDKLDVVFGIIEKFGDVSLFYQPNGFLPDPRTQKINIQPYLQDRQLSTLKRILESHQDEPIFLDGYDFNWEEAQVIRDAMINNPRFIFICPEENLERLFHAFELIGYQRHKNVFTCILDQSINLQQNLYGCLFIK